MGLNAERLLSNLETFGFIFESLCEHDLRICAEYHGGRLFHYHNSNDNEIDAIVEMYDGSWGTFVVKLGAGVIDGAVKNLDRICNLLVRNGAEPQGQMRDVRDHRLRLQEGGRGVCRASDDAGAVRIDVPMNSTLRSVIIEEP